MQMEELCSASRMVVGWKYKSLLHPYICYGIIIPVMERDDMGKVSVKENKNIYQIARENLGLSRAAAADKMYEHGLTEYRLVKIEDGTVKIQPEDVVAMSKGYNEPELRNHYCCHECPIGKIDAPEVIYKNNVHEILVNMSVSLESVNKNKLRLMEILADGKVDSDEASDFDKISEELEKISMTIEALQLWCEKMKTNEK